ncbi:MULTISPECIES: hypothetical protein [Klebsiella pneumoniae complex]|nr:hypothetical protein [Klebsiella pneumoniae]
MRRNAQKWIPFGFDTDSNKIVDIASVENGLCVTVSASSVGPP